MPAGSTHSAGGPDSLSIEARYPEGRHDRQVEETRLEVSVPRGTHLEANGVSADVFAEGLTGDVRLSSVSGDIESDFGTAVKDGRRLDATAGQGDANIRVETFSGEVVIKRR